MTRIQNSFYDLQQELIEALIYESLNKLQQKTISKAQVAVDILIRNLYERTADVGFIATDDDIRKFVSLSDISDSMREEILNRLKEYVAKYSVYEEIIILDKDYNVLVNLDNDNHITGTRIQDEVLEETISTNQSFIEYFGPSLLQSKRENAHIFLSKIYSENTNSVIGIVCLCFKFENEMDQIFKKLSTDYDGSVILIIDKDNKVIASSDENHVPVGISVETGNKEKNEIAYYRGMEYISKTIDTQGYQGYFGLGWKGHLMIPLNLAFKEKTTKSLKNIDKDLLLGLMNRADSFSTILRDIVNKTQQINRSLRQIVFNGQILSKVDRLTDEYIRLKPLLASIGKMGNNTSQLFDKSIKNLFSTLISTSLSNVSFLASLCIDIMDRNLYERANDCRWWALNSTFKTILASVQITDTDQKKLTEILSYINSLYTVYSNLFLFDKDGKIVAVSNPKHNDDIGKTVDNQYIRNILDNSFAENYYVSPWEQSEFYNDRYTYTYGASITDINNNRRVVGGIGIIFDSEFQFETMLNDAIGAKEGSFAVFTDTKGKIISSTNKNLIVGDRLKVSAELFEIKNGVSHSQIIVYDDCYYAVGCACSFGYREYKISDNYKNDVLSFVFEKLADFEHNDSLKIKNFHIDQSDFHYSDNENHVKFVTFHINKQMFSLKQSVVLESLEANNIISLPVESGIIKGAVLYNNKYIGVIDPNDLFGLTSGKTMFSHALILELSKDNLIALKVEEINIIIEVDESYIKTVTGFGGERSIVNGVISIKGDDSRSILILNHETILNRLDGSSFDDKLAQKMILGE